MNPLPSYIASAHRTRAQKSVVPQWHQLALTLVLLSSLLRLGHCAPAVSDSAASQSLEAISAAQTDMLMKNILDSKLENQCDTNQDRKDLCERCIRFVFERSTGYLGCCTNFDGIYNFCEKFLDYSFDDVHMSKAHQSSNKMSNGVPYFRK